MVLMFCLRTTYAKILKFSQPLNHPHLHFPDRVYCFVESAMPFRRFISSIHELRLAVGKRLWSFYSRVELSANKFDLERNTYRL